jgi:MFS transporter, FHS family, glucose/mannose:H+ symporter
MCILCETPLSMEISKRPAALPNPRAEWPLLHLSFILIGVITTFLGPILPFFSRHWALTDAQSGFFFATQYFGSFLGVILTGWMLPRFGFSKVNAMGFAAFLLGFSVLGIGPWWLAAALVAVSGFGYGLTNPAINLRATQLPSANTAAAVTFLNFSWSIGSVLCPYLVGLLVPRIGILGMAASIAAAALVLGALHLSIGSKQPVVVKAPPIHSLADWSANLRHPAAISLVALFFLYVGTEVAIGGWVATHERRMLSLSASAVAFAPSVFYGSLLFGRGIAPLILRRVSELYISAGGLLCATIGGIILTTAHTPAALFGGTALAGLGLAPQYPILVTWLAAIYGKDSEWMGVPFFCAAGLGGSAIPWLVGIVASQTHSLRNGLYVPLTVCAIMLLLAFRAHPKKSAA